MSELLCHALHSACQEEAAAEASLFCVHFNSAFFFFDKEALFGFGTTKTMTGGSFLYSHIYQFDDEIRIAQDDAFKVIRQARVRTRSAAAHMRGNDRRIMDM